MGYKGFKLICIKLTFYTLRIIILKIENDIYFNNFKIINMENEVKQKCTNCKVSREQKNFIGKSENIVKRCLKCREKDAKQKKRPDVIEKRNKRQNEKNTTLNIVKKKEKKTKKRIYITMLKI